MQQTATRTIFVWDVHGCYSELKKLIKTLKITHSDRVFFVWDLIFKWPKSLKVLKYIYKNKKQFKWVIWNKEHELFEAIKNKQYYSKTEKKLAKKLQNKYPKILEYMYSVPYYREENDFILVHAWVVPWVDLDDQKKIDLCYLREFQWKPWYEYYSWPKKIIYGHWAVDWLQIHKYTIGLDSWCVYGWKLSAYILESWELIQINSKKMYKNPYKKAQNESRFQNIFKKIQAPLWK